MTGAPIARRRDRLRPRAAPKPTRHGRAARIDTLATALRGDLLRRIYATAGHDRQSRATIRYLSRVLDADREVIFVALKMLERDGRLRRFRGQDGLYTIALAAGDA